MAVRPGVKWSNLEQQAPDSIPATGHMLKMALKLTTWVPIDHTQSTSIYDCFTRYKAAVGQVVHHIKSRFVIYHSDQCGSIKFMIYVSGLAEQANNGLFPFTAISSLRTYNNPVQANKSSKTANESSFPRTKRQTSCLGPCSTAKEKELQISAYRPLEARMIARNLADIK